MGHPVTVAWILPSTSNQCRERWTEGKLDGLGLNDAGDVKHVMEIEKWRSKLKLPPTTASVFALSKVSKLPEKLGTFLSQITNRFSSTDAMSFE